MSKNKKLAAKNKALKKNLSLAQGQLAKSETRLAKARAKAARWKKEAAAQRAAASRSGARAEKLQRKLDRAAVAVRPNRSTAPEEPAASSRAATKRTTASEVAVPDQTWSVVQLKAEARARGLVGMSNKPKAHLLAALS